MYVAADVCFINQLSHDTVLSIFILSNLGKSKLFDAFQKVFVTLNIMNDTSIKNRQVKLKGFLNLFNDNSLCLKFEKKTHKKVI